MATDPRHYEYVRGEIRTSDLLLFRGRGPVAWAIGLAGRSPYTHAAKAIWCRNNLMCAEVRELRGGRLVSLSSQVRLHSGRIDVFTLAPEFDAREHPVARYDREGAASVMLGLCGEPYGYRALWRAAWSHLAVVRLFTRPKFDDGFSSDLPLFCSSACAVADRTGGGVDPVPTLADQWVEPADLARSALWRYRFTLEA